MIHPRRLSGSASNIARYYAVGDYYSKGADEQSQWGGALAAGLGLQGKVDPLVFRELLAGHVAGQQLGRHRANGETEHHPGWDFAVNAPKSVSIMALVAGDDRIVAAHEQAVGIALAYLEEHASLRRRDEGEIVHETTGRLLFARFTEHASRELDPHLHTHVVVMNMTNQEAGAPMASLETRAMFAEQMVAGQVYRNELAHGLREFGYEIDSDPRKGLFEIRGVPVTLISEMSQRAEQIEAHAKEHGLSGQAARRRSFYETRCGKDKVWPDDLRSAWAQRAEPHRAKLSNLVDESRERGERMLSVEQSVVSRALLFGIRQAETCEAVNNLGRILRTGLAANVGEVRLADLKPLVTQQEARAKLLATHMPTGDRTLTRGRTSRRTLRLEEALSRHLAYALDDAQPIASADRLLPVLERAGLTPTQEQALVQVATSRDRVNGIHGVAGAGKSTLIRAMNEAAEPGTTLIALAPTSSAAANLGETAGISSRTVASLIASGGRGIDRHHVLVLDEAGQLGNRQALRVLEISRETGARLILVGDDKQTGAIEQGKAFWLLQRLGLPTAQLSVSMRQETRAMKAAVTQARIGDYAGSLSHLDKVVSGASAETLAGKLVEEWTRLKPESRATTNILVLENATRIVVNNAVRATLKREGAVATEDTRFQVLTASGMSDQEKCHARFYFTGQVVTFARDVAGMGLARDTEYRVLGISQHGKRRQSVRLVDEHGRVVRWNPQTTRAMQVNVFQQEERDLAQGDRVQWRLANKPLDLRNAERGTVEKLNGTRATIRWDRHGAIKIIDLAEHRTWDHGYAETVYSAQSKTYFRAYVLAPVDSALVNGQNYYTAITRARLGVKLWTEDETRLAEKLTSRPGEKTSALEGLGRLDRDSLGSSTPRHLDCVEAARVQQERGRSDRRHAILGKQLDQRSIVLQGLPNGLAQRARGVAGMLDRVLTALVDQAPSDADPRMRPSQDPRAHNWRNFRVDVRRSPER